MCTGFIAQTNPGVRVLNTKGTSHEHLGNGIQSSPASEECDGSPGTEGTSDGHLDTGLPIFQSSEECNCVQNTKGASDEHLDTGPPIYQPFEEYDRLFNSQGPCIKYGRAPIHASISDEQFHCLYVSIKDLFLKIEYAKRIRQYNNERGDGNGELTHECC